MILFGSADFWRLWLAGFVISVVRWIETVAVGVFVYQTTASAFLVALVTLLRMLPLGLFGAFIGALADRVERRTALILMVAVMLTTSLTLAVLAYFSWLAIWHLALASFIGGFAWAADNPVRRMMIGAVVGTDRMSTAMSIDMAAGTASRIVGPAVGGFLLATAGIQGAFALAVALYLVAAVAAVGIRHRTAPVNAAGSAVLAHMIEGLRAVRTNNRLRGLLVLVVIFDLFGWPFTSMIPVIGQDNLHLGAEGIGLLTSMEGIGAFCSAVAIALHAKAEHHVRIYIGGLVLYLVMLTLFALSPHPLLAGAALLATGLGAAAFTILETTLVYQSVPEEMRGRVLGVLSACIGLGPIGFLHLGLLADAIGAKSATIVMGVEGLLALLLTWPLWRAVVAESPQERMEGEGRHPTMSH